jgi:class 3 adenylate cyclase
MAWNEEAARERIKESWAASEGVVVKPLVKEVSLDNLSLQCAYDVDGVHVYVDIPNALTLVGDDAERDHKKALRFIHIMSRVAHLVFQRTDAVKIDIQNTRIHFVLYKPYDSERVRVQCAVAIADVIRVALLAGNALHEELPDARVVVGIESGRALAVRNGTRSEREPLFLGDPANQAAKLTGAEKAAGIYLGSKARSVLGSSFSVADPSSSLTAAQVAECALAAKLGISIEDMTKAWADEIKKTPISEFSFSRWTPPLSNAALDELSPANSRRQEMVVIYADVDGFTAYVAKAIANGTEKTAVRVLHVIRKEMRDVLNDFKVKKIRYIGDCVQGIAAEGTAHTTDEEKTVSTAALAAAAMRSSFELIRTELGVAELGIQIGFEIGATAASRVGVQGSRDRIVISEASLTAEREQRRCSASETAIGRTAYDAAPQAIREAFGPTRKSAEIDYPRLCARLNRSGSSSASDHGSGPAFPQGVRPRAHAR